MQTVNIKAEQKTVIKFKNVNYKGVVLNYEDWDFVKTRFDPESLKLFQS